MYETSKNDFQKIQIPFFKYCEQNPQEEYPYQSHARRHPSVRHWRYAVFSPDYGLPFAPSERER